MEPERFATSTTTKYRPEYCEKIVEYFNKTPFTVMYDENGNQITSKSGPIKDGVPFPTPAGFCAEIGISERTLSVWLDKKRAFKRAYERAIAHQHHILVQCAMAGAYNAQFAMFYARCKMGMRDGSEEDQKALPVNIIYNVENARVRDTPKDEAD